MKKFLLLALIALLLAPLASAGSIDVLFGAGAWAWPGGVGSVLSATSFSVKINNTFGALPIAILSGPAIGGAGTLFNPYTWGAGGIMVVGGCGGPCFAGTFTGLQAAYTGFGGMTFVGSYVAGTVDPILLAFLGLNPNVTSFSGLIHFDVSPAPASFALGSGRNPDGSVKVGTLGSGDLHIQPVPEPGTLALFGSGLLGVAGVVRRRLSL